MNKTIVNMVAEKLKGIMASDNKLPWLKPWNNTKLDKAVSHNTLKPYSLMNQLLIGENGEFLTFNQIKKENGRLKAGSKAKQIIFWGFFEPKKDNEEKETKKIPMLRYYNVFNINDCEGIEPKIKEELNKEIKTDEQIDEIINSYSKAQGLKIEKCFSNRAFYSPLLDTIQLPKIEQFLNKNLYYHTIFHELVHSTGCMERLGRFERANKDSQEEYSQEELVAEIGAATLMNKLGLENDETLKNSASYIQGWQKVLTEKPEAFIIACGRAEKAVNLILGETEE